MNAYELAYKLNNALGVDYEMLEQSSIMLRQQADRIAELEKLLKHSVGADCREMRYIQEIENKDARIAELEKQGEPVAWWTGKYEDEGEDFMFPNTRQAHIDHPQSETHKFFSTPLYTTPQTKPLSDADIEEISHQYHYTYNPDYVGFARAIEERHGIK